MLFEDAENLALAAMEDWGLSGWTFAFDNAKRRCGCCNHTRRKITLSRHYVRANTRADVRDTILHEVAHALAGGRAGHGPYWKQWARAVGARPQRCVSDDVVMPEGAIKGVCIPGCKARHVRHRMPPARLRYSYTCNRCHSWIEWVRVG
jgi:predicted SprT family Zn-dependent metalloprotease